MKFKEQIYGMKAYQPGKPIEEVQKEFGLKEVIKLASNENPFGCSPKVKEFIKNNDINYAIYPDGYAQELRTAVSKHLGVEENQLLFGSGSDDIIAIISRALLYPGVNTVMADPSFSQYSHNAEIEGAEIRKVPLKDGKHDLEKMFEAIDENTSIVWICNPNNPTGTIVADEELSAFLKKVPKEVLVVLDEAYFEYITDPAYQDTLHYVEEYPNVIIMRTFSKAYGLAAFRVGYAIGQADVISKLEPVRAPFNNTVLSQKVAIVALEDQEFIKETVERTERAKRQYEEFCKKHGLKYYPSQTNFILFEVKTDSDVIFQEMMKRGFIVRSGNALGTPGFIRVSFGTEEQNSKFLETLEGVLKEQGALV
ncbi:histidinol-phosphate transaminase [Ureibacillus sp. FSL K6-8385]|uniref:Histidinol-phosphate aminotransferase n=1 Tax=Ureibacillus terrenus TaxID=118246 RepID=A0A540V8A1_9BACL|nr:histidinol-phosphate transaminase [Ureibacillus terrenus]MED3660635.1 histidinol-phosphate transaminase [Ureibacillus terrenus]TQE92373.1 histidinol-phosphate transaminase [Ureibacillus terrenus]